MTPGSPRYATGPGSLEDELDALEADSDFLEVGGVFTDDLSDTTTTSDLGRFGDCVPSERWPVVTFHAVAGNGGEWRDAMSIIEAARQRIAERRGAPSAVDLGATASPKTLNRRQLRQWVTNGYLVLPGFFSAEQTELITKDIGRLWDERRTDDHGLGIDAYIDTPQERRMRFRHAPDEARDLPYKLNDVYLVSDSVRETILDPRLVNVVADLLDGTPLVCNSLTFERGSQQRFHFDTFYMPPLVPNKMLATWIALEDADDRAGPLRYYPGSHLIPPYHFSHGALHALAEEMPAFDEYITPELESRQLESTTFPARQGDVFIWHAQLYHGGAPIEDMSLTRKSLVTHYLRVEDMERPYCEDIGGGRFYLKRDHQLPPDPDEAEGAEGERDGGTGEASAAS